jgi:hypothetical protein
MDSFRFTILFVFVLPEPLYLSVTALSTKEIQAANKYKKGYEMAISSLEIIFNLFDLQTTISTMHTDLFLYNI